MRVQDQAQRRRSLWVSTLENRHFQGLYSYPEAAIFFVRSASYQLIYVVLNGSLCTTDRRARAQVRVFVDAFSFCSQIPVLLVIYSCEQKMTSSVKATKQAWILDPEDFHQQSYPQAGVF